MVEVLAFRRRLLHTELVDGIVGASERKPSVVGIDPGFDRAG